MCDCRAVWVAQVQRRWCLRAVAACLLAHKRMRIHSTPADAPQELDDMERLADKQACWALLLGQPV